MDEWIRKTGSYLVYKMATTVKFQSEPNVEKRSGQVCVNMYTECSTPIVCPKA